jgi:hypothetical protein
LKKPSGYTLTTSFPPVTIIKTMAEAFGLVAGILQVVDFGRQYVSTAYKLYKSGVDGAESLSDLQAFANNLQAVLDTLHKHSQNTDGISGSPMIGNWPKTALRPRFFGIRIK